MPKRPGFNLLVGGLLLMALTLQVAIAQADQPLQLQPSAAAQKALAYIAAGEGIPSEALIVWADYPTEYPRLGRKFQVT